LKNIEVSKMNCMLLTLLFVGVAFGNVVDAQTDVSWLKDIPTDSRKK
jgi:hypothetical protein